MFLQKFASIHPADVKIFHKMRENFDLNVSLNEKSEMVNPLRSMGVCTKVHSRPSKGFFNILIDSHIMQ